MEDSLICSEPCLGAVTIHTISAPGLLKGLGNAIQPIASSLTCTHCAKSRQNRSKGSGGTLGLGLQYWQQLESRQR